MAGKMAKTWKQEMDLDGELTPAEKDIFIKKITAAGVPSVEEYAEEQGKDRNEVEHEYYDKYGEEIRTARDTATEEAPTGGLVLKVTGSMIQKQAELLSFK
jgi:hypothetical protein